MKKILPYLLGVLVVVLVVWLIVAARSSRHSFDDRISFNRRDKIPYGMYVAFKSLPEVFPGAVISTNRKAPGYWDELNSLADNQALVIIVPDFRADAFEMKRLVDFIKNGNNVFISAASVSSEAQTILRAEIPDVSDINDNLFTNHNTDSFSVSLASPPFSSNPEYGCPGKRLESYFSKYDSGIATVLGNGIYIMPNLLRFRAGKGNLYLHLTPLAFSNYFLLCGHNMDYYSKVFSLLPPKTSQIVWDEYFLYKRPDEENEGAKSDLSALMSQRSFRAALWLMIALLALFILQEMRRKQRFIPPMGPLRNDSLEFVKTIGRLYYEKRDNKNLSLKMSAYFREYVRTRFKLSTATLDEDFIGALQRKSGQPGENVREIVFFINDVDKSDVISDEQLARFHRKLGEFYKLA